MDLYGMTPEDFAALLVAQRGACPICGKLLAKPAVDHDHSLASGSKNIAKRRAIPAEQKKASVRGLVCAFPCNYVMLRKGFTAAMHENAAIYLRNPPARGVL